MEITYDQFCEAESLGLVPTPHKLTGFADHVFRCRPADEVLADVGIAEACPIDTAVWKITAQEWHAAIGQVIEAAMAAFEPLTRAEAIIIRNAKERGISLARPDQLEFMAWDMIGKGLLMLIAGDSGKPVMVATAKACRLLSINDHVAMAKV